MKSTYYSGAAASAPAWPSSPSHGRATDGNLATAVPATTPGAAWFDMVTQELVAVVTAAGLTPDHTSSTQVRDAILALAGGAANTAGDIKMRAASAVPSGWLECNGATVSRTTYATLFAAIGTTYGAGDGSTTFGLPDMRGEFPRGWDHGRGADSGRALGSVQAEMVGPHVHPPYNGGQFFGSGGTANTQIPDLDGGAVDNFKDATTGNNSGTENRPRNVALMFVIKT